MIPGMMNGGDKKLASVILAGPSPAEADEGDIGLKTAAEEIISAVHAKDARGLMEAMKSFFELSEESEESEGQEAESESEDHMK